MANVLSNFETWKKFLAERVEHGKNIGLSEDSISDLAYEIGSFLGEKVDPKNEQEQALKEIWEVGNEEERKTIAGLMVKLVQKS
ncbi:DUF3243 domain-containing protein [Paenibacillus nasutitermitis]|uniref:DUF3243 domain-containing protein n=1 Tax=Paenibacillus nasutitermitis TaxID=1652958 RepID=A0A916YZV3_9BACL|nr:DUF3243 domain-containing protein [Paenibacillus nasutitermitis]GGD67780.1 hypothetical protein GCM10010911_26990 [Paenibacillus nasutitermitis]